MSETDMILIDTNLIANHTYTYQAQIPASASGGNSLSADGSPVQVRTMDTTSHSWTFTTTLLGNGNPSVLYDVAIVNDTCIWAVGEIVQDGVTYNAAKWDKQEWNLLRIPYIYQGSPIYSSIKWVFALNENDIWFGNSVHWNGQNFHNVDIGISIFYGIGPNKMWASTSGQFYVVGNNGTIAFSSNHGSTWTKLESGTSTNINDVYGLQNIRSGQLEVYCAVTDFFQPKDRKILKITERGRVDSIPWTPGRNIFSVWSSNGSFLYAAGNGLFENSSGEWKKIEFGVYTNHIRGSAANNVFVVGDFGLIGHFNGSTWKTFYPEPDADYSSVSVKNNLMIAVGRKSGQAIAMVGKLN
jgi:hypothetical protein